MKLSELFANLSFGPLANLAIGGNGTGFVPPENHARLVSYTNKALLALYSRFLIKEKEVIVRAYSNRKIYPLRTIYADSETISVGQKFIQDSLADRFQEDVIKILQVYLADGSELRLNDPSDEESLFTPSLDTLQIPNPVGGTLHYVLYQARHPVLGSSNLDQVIELPEILQEALEAHVAHQIYSSMNGQEHGVKAAEHYARYDMLCSDVEARDLAQTSLLQGHDKLHERGFV